MSSTTPITSSERRTDLQRMPDRRGELRPASGPARIVGAIASALGMSLVAALYLIAAPLVALATGTIQILTDVRDNAVRPRPFVGANHGLPFLDPPPATHSTIAENTDEE